jgi:V/A-type H+-transporting ATPase subunit K
MDLRQREFFRKVVGSVAFVGLVLLMLGVFSATNVFAQEAEEPAAAEMSEAEASVAKFGFIAAAIAFGLGALGAGLGIAHVGAAAMGAISEKPEIAGQALIFIALAEGLVIFGFIMGLLILGRI